MHVQPFYFHNYTQGKVAYGVIQNFLDKDSKKFRVVGITVFLGILYFLEDMIRFGMK